MQKQSPNPKGPGLAGAAAVIAGGLTFFYLAAPGHEQNAVHHAIAWVLAFSGHAVPAFARSVFGALCMAGVAAGVAGFFTPSQAQRQEKEAVKSAKAAMAADAARNKLEQQQRGRVASDAIVEQMSGEAARRRSQVTPGFVMVLTIGCVAVIAAFKLWLDHH